MVECPLCGNALPEGTTIDHKIDDKGRHHITARRDGKVGWAMNHDEAEARHKAVARLHAAIQGWA